MSNTGRTCVMAALCVALMVTVAYAQAPTQPQPTAATGGTITTPRIGTSVTQQGVLSGEGATFVAANTPTVWAVFDFAGMQPGSTLIVWWSDPGTQSSIPWQVTLPAASGTVAASLTAPATGWAPGSYEVTVTPVDGVPALAKVPFTLQ